MTELTTIAFNIETMGFQAGNKRTVVGFDSAVSSRVFLHTGTTPQTASQIGSTTSSRHRYSSHSMTANRNS
jgi:hypothetical protein